MGSKAVDFDSAGLCEWDANGNELWLELLSAPADVMTERLTTRTNNSYGKTPSEAARILEQKETIEPLLRRAATVEVDSSAPIDKVLASIVGLARQKQSVGD